jgi:hypothetical protein
MSSDIYRTAREIAGPTGNIFSNGWQQLEDGQSAYVKSFDRRLPPSLHISERDAVRAGRAMPMSERCIEDYTKRRQPGGDDDDRDRWTFEELERVDRRRRRRN